MQAAHHPDDSLGSRLHTNERPFGSDASGLDGTFKDLFDALARQIERVIRGKRRAVHLALVCLFSEGHLLIEDVPGVGKTSLAKAIARSIGGTWRRVQFTPDLLPSDVTGVSVWDRTRSDFEFRPGGVFANVVLADEINRASPKTQSALLEAMEERQVTIDAQTYTLPSPFLVIATQNPVELEGTYPAARGAARPLPACACGSATPTATRRSRSSTREDDERRSRPKTSSPSPTPRPSRRGSRELGRVHVAPELQGYIVDIVEATRHHRDLMLGVSPRGALASAAGGARARREHRPFVRRARRREGARAVGARTPADAVVGGDDAGRQRRPTCSRRSSTSVPVPAPPTAVLTPMLTRRGWVARRRRGRAVRRRAPPRPRAARGARRRRRAACSSARTCGCGSDAPHARSPAAS